MAEQTSYKLDWGNNFSPPVLTVTTKKTYQAKGPLSYFQEPFQSKGVWVMGDGPPQLNETVCETVEQMLERGWIEEVQG